MKDLYVSWDEYNRLIEKLTLREIAQDDDEGGASERFPLDPAEE